MQLTQQPTLQDHTCTQNPAVMTTSSNPLGANQNGMGPDTLSPKGATDINAWLEKSLGMKDSSLDSGKGSNPFDRRLAEKPLSNDNEMLSQRNDKDVLTGIQDNNTSNSGSIAESDILSTQIKNPESAVLAANIDLSGSNNSQKVYYVSPNGSDENPGTSEKPWKSVNYAVSEGSPVKAGDTILVQPGTYNELITLGKSGDAKLGDITLKANGDVTLRDPDANNGGFREGVIQSADKGHWVIDGFRIENTSWAGIALRDAYNMTVQNNHTFETGSSGIIVLPESYYDGGEAEVTSKNIKVLNNTIERANWKFPEGGDQEALSMWGVDGFEVAHNTLKEGKREGLDIKVGSRNGSVHNNSVTAQALVSGTAASYRGGPAIYLDGNRADMYNIDVYNNTVYNNTSDGIMIADEAPSQGDVSDIRVYNNVVYGNGQKDVNGGQGITITSNVRNVEVVNNTVSKNLQPLYIDGSEYTAGYKPRDIVVRNNIFTDSVYHNGFIEDVENLTLENNLFSKQFPEMFRVGNGVTNLKQENNKQVDSVGFVNLDSNDFRLTANSPAIDTGSSQIGEYAKLDREGQQRGQGQGTDIGAYELKA